MFPPIFTGELVRLTASLPEDRDIFASWTQDDDYMRLLDDDPIRPQSSATYASFGEPAKPDDYYFHLRTIADNHLIGFVVLFNLKWRNQAADLAIGIGAREYRSKGYGVDALRVMLRYAFSELGLRRVSLTVMDYNIRAINAYERVGFKREGAQRQAIYRDGKLYDLLNYGILRDEWLEMQRP